MEQMKITDTPKMSPANSLPAAETVTFFQLPDEIIIKILVAAAASTEEFPIELLHFALVCKLFRGLIHESWGQFLKPDYYKEDNKEAKRNFMQFPEQRKEEYFRSDIRGRDVFAQQKQLEVTAILSNANLPEQAIKNLQNPIILMCVKNGSLSIERAKDLHLKPLEEANLKDEVIQKYLDKGLLKFDQARNLSESARAHLNHETILEYIEDKKLLLKVCLPSLMRK